MTNRLSEQAAKAANDISGLGNSSGEAVQETAARLLDQGRRKIAEVGTQVNGYVTEKPVKSLMVAAGAGVLLGLVLSRWRR